MKDEIKEILEYFKESNINDFGYEQDKLISYEEAQIILDYITNLQEQLETYKDTETYSKNFLYKENKERLKANQRLQQAKDSLQNDYQEAVDKINELQQENKRLKRYMNSYGNYKLLEKNINEKEHYKKSFIYVSKEALDYKSRNEKAIEYIKWNYNHNRLSKVFNDKILEILQGSDK